MTNDDRLTIRTAAVVLGVHPNTVRNRIRQGVYPSARLEDDGKGGRVWTVDRADLGTADTAVPDTAVAVPDTPPPAPQGAAGLDPGEVVTKALAPLMAELVALTDRLAQAQADRADSEVARRVAEHRAEGLRSEVDRLAAALEEARQPRRWWGGRRRAAGKD